MSLAALHMEIAKNMRELHVHGVFGVCLMFYEENGHEKVSAISPSIGAIELAEKVERASDAIAVGFDAVKTELIGGARLG